MRNTRLSAFFLCLCFIIFTFASCSLRGPLKPSYQPANLTPFIGVWEGYGGVGLPSLTAEATLSISEHQAGLEYRVKNRRIRAELNLLGMLKDALHYEVTKTEITNLTQEQAKLFPLGHIVVPFPQDHSGRGMSMLFKAYPKDQTSTTSTKPSRRSRTSSKFRVKKVIALKDRQTTRYGFSQILYQDWRDHGGLANRSGQGQIYWEGKPITESAGTSDPDTRLAEDLKKLIQRGGWKCLSQVNKEIPTSEFLRVELKSAPNFPRLHLIYIRNPSRSISYSLSKKPSGYVKIYNGTFNYPVAGTNGWTTVLKMGKQPIPGMLDRGSTTTPVTIFVLGNTFGDYGSGCNLEEFGL